MVTLKNVGGAVRVVFDINRKPHVIPPTGEVKLMLSEPSLKRFAKAAEKGDTLLVMDVDYQPLEEPEQPNPPNQPATNGHSEPPVAAAEQPATQAAPAPMPAPAPVPVAAVQAPTPRPNRRQRRQGVDRNG